MKLKLRRMYVFSSGIIKPFNTYIYVFKIKDSNTVIGESLLSGNTLFIRKKRTGDNFKELRQIKL